MWHRFCALLLCVALFVAGGIAFAAEGGSDLLGSLKAGSVELKSAGPLAFGPQGILFIGDPVAATVYAVDTGEHKASDSNARPKVEGVTEKIGGLLGVEAKNVSVKGLAVNPLSGTTYMSVARGKGAGAGAVVVRVDRTGKLSELSLKNIKSASTALPNPVKSASSKRGDPRMMAITHMAYLKGRLLIAGLSNEEFASNMRSIPFPFDKTDRGSSVRIYHGAHGKFETNSPIRVFTTYNINGKDHLLAAYTCTPLVKLPVASLKPGEKLNAVTVAELGNRNQPLSIIVYKKGGKDYLLMANSSRGVMKVGLDGVDSIEGITKRINGTAGLKYETVKDLKGIEKLDAFDKDHALVLVNDSGNYKLQTIELP